MNPLKCSLALAPCVAIALSLSSIQAATTVWTNPGVGNWDNPANWNNTNAPGNIPAAGDDSRVNNGGTAVIDASQNISSLFVILADNTGTTGNLIVSGGSLTTSSDIRIGNGGTAGGTGVITHSGGAITQTGGNLNVGFGDTAVGTYDMSGGSIAINVGGILAVGNRGMGTFNQSAGSVYVRNTTGTSQINLGRNVASSKSSGAYTLSGGSVTTASLRYGNAAGSAASSTNIFRLQGGSLTVSNIAVINTAAENSFIFSGGTLTALSVGMSLTNSGGTLSPASLSFGSAGVAPNTAAEVVTSQIGTVAFTGANGYRQSAGGNLAIDISDTANDFVSIGSGGSAIIAGTISLSLLGGYDPAIGSSFDILTAGSIANTALVSGQTPSGFGFDSSVVPGGTGGQLLRVTVVPEPGTLALFGVSALALFIRSRSLRNKK